MSNLSNYAMIDLSKIEIEMSPPDPDPAADAQVMWLLARMAPGQAVVLPAAVAYLAQVKSLGMGLDVDLRLVSGSDTELRLYMIGSLRRVPR